VAFSPGLLYNNSREGIERGGNLLHKVVSVGCDRYELGTVEKNLKAALSELGGIRSLIPAGSSVFLKVNLLTGRDPKDAVTTHPVVVQALAAILIENGCRVTIGDSPGGPFLPDRMNRIYRVTGVAAAAKASGAALNENLTSVTASFPEAHRLKSFEVMQAVDETEYVISLCKMKTHSMTLMTGAVKNMFGIMPGLTKAALHFRFPKLVDFAHAMVDICEYKKPILSVMDGIEAMEGAGPSAGTVVNANVLLVSTSPHHLDVAAARWMGINPIEVPLLQAASERGLCDRSGADIEWIGLDPEAKAAKPFKTPLIHEPDFLKRASAIPVAGALLEAFSSHYLKPRPVVQEKICIGCQECHVICPAEAIQMHNNRPVFDLEKCIRCFCCQEICPVKAILIHRSWLLNKLSQS
jgi:uncharacterized protein (DUF362 family)/Pyruvate/2-oxoacid:ferredoxin oxidoreductase delta subunit